MCQLVLQFAAKAPPDYGALVALERQLAGQLGESAVDGHDVGSGEANIFIHTSDPQSTFRQLLPLLERTPHFSALTAAYRRTDEEHYHVLWPENSLREFSVA